MGAISGRIRRLEGQLGLSKADEETAQRLWERIEAGRRRLAESVGQPYVPRPFGSAIPYEIRGLSLDEILQRGRMRCARG